MNDELNETKRDGIVLAIPETISPYIPSSPSFTLVPDRMHSSAAEV